MTYSELLEAIQQMPEARRADDVTIFVSGVGECYAALEFGPESDIDQQGDIRGALDNGHYILKI